MNIPIQNEDKQIGEGIKTVRKNQCKKRSLYNSKKKYKQDKRTLEINSKKKETEDAKKSRQDPNEYKKPKPMKKSRQSVIEYNKPSLDNFR